MRSSVHWSSRLDYCNGILANAPLGLVNSLQSVMRSAAHHVLRLPPWGSITQLMRDQLQWLPVQQRITFKLSTMAYNASMDLLQSISLGSVPALHQYRHVTVLDSNPLLIPAPRMSTVSSLSVNC